MLGEEAHYLAQSPIYVRHNRPVAIQEEKETFEKPFKEAEEDLEDFGDRTGVPNPTARKMQEEIKRAKAPPTDSDYSPRKKKSVGQLSRGRGSHLSLYRGAASWLARTSASLL